MMPHPGLVLIVLLLILCGIVRAYESGAVRDYCEEMRRKWCAAGVLGRILAIIVLTVFGLHAYSKGPSPAAQIFRMLFWHPSSPWQLVGPSSTVDAAEEAVAQAEADMADTANIVTNNSVYTLSFGWHPPSRVPFHDRQNILAWTAAVVSTNINGVLFEDHYVCFNSTASTNPAVILIEYARTLDDGSVERQSATVITNSFPDTAVVELQSGSHTCYWFRCEVPSAYTNAVRDWSGEALFGSPADSGKGFDLLGTLVIDDDANVWVGATTNIVLSGITNTFANGINVTEEEQ